MCGVMKPRVVCVWCHIGYHFTLTTNFANANQFFKILSLAYLLVNLWLVIKYPTTPQMRHYTTLWNISMSPRCNCTRADIPSYRVQWLQSVMSDAAQTIFKIRACHLTALSTPPVDSSTAGRAGHPCIQMSAWTGPCLSCWGLQLTVSSNAHHCLWSTIWTSLFVCRVCLSTVSDQAFPVAAARTWNSLP